MITIVNKTSSRSAPPSIRARVNRKTPGRVRTPKAPGFHPGGSLQTKRAHARISPPGWNPGALIPAHRHPLWAVLMCLIAAGGTGCGGGVSFPMDPLAETGANVGAHRAYDTDDDGKADFFTFTDPAGVASILGYDTTGDGRPDIRVDTAAIPFARCRHLVIILDGFAYDLVKGWYDAGYLRMFHPPARVVSTYPSMTDLALGDALGSMPSAGVEALYFDRKGNELVGGNLAYLAGDNAPYTRMLQYRAPAVWDAAAYVAAWPVFNAEIDAVKDRFDQGDSQEVIAYFVGSAGVSTREGADGQKKCLRRVEQLVNEVLWQSRGLAKVTLMSDHGHSYTPATRIDIEGHLERRGWDIRDCLDDGKSAVHVRFGLVTCANFATRRPEALARDVSTADGVELTSYASGTTVVVLGPGGAEGVIARKGAGYSYRTVSGDPLGVKGILSTVPADKDGFRDRDALLAATARHTYPAPLQRLWRAHFALAANPPDVIVSLADRYFSGAKGMTHFLDIASTHGSLNYTNSVTFIMTTAGDLPPVMRSGDIPRNMQALTGVAFPMRK